MTKFKSLVLTAMFALSAVAFTSCDAAEKLCGPCGDVYAGDDFISGDARLDGLFKAVGSFGKATAAIDASFRADVEALADVFGVEYTADMDIGDLVADVKGEINAEINASVSGSLKVVFVEPKCEASVNVAVEAQANCEAKAGCEVSAECEGGELAVSCEGTCSGSCSGGCTGGCKVEASGTCEGKCEGSCSLDVAATCEGVCKGECSGECSAYVENASGEMECDGKCEGECTGTCELAAAAECSGECHGKCEIEVEGECEGECHGSCDAECSGGCEGTATPPSCSAEGSCEASADCQASASAQASAELSCTPPRLDIRFEFDASLDAAARAEFTAKMAELKVRMVGIIQGMFKMRALIDADYAAEIGIEPPIAQITGQVQGMVNANFDDFDIPAGRLVCVLPAFEDSVDIMVEAGTSLTGTLQAQIDIVGVLDIM